jgi:hypothetical protein
MDVQQRMVLAFLRLYAEGAYRDKSGKRHHCVKWNKFFWIARPEDGERTGRAHWHVLIHGLPFERHNPSDRFVAKKLWEQVNGGEVSDFRRFDSTLAGARYVLKGLHNWTEKNANAYEVGKFSRLNVYELMIGHTLLAKWAGSSTHQSSTARTLSGNPATSLSHGRKTRAQRTKQATTGSRVLYGMHPAGVSFVR